jgi:peptidoglycan/xylan/chitin deacetylase (PgdA/CDA1 family)
MNLKRKFFYKLSQKITPYLFFKVFRPFLTRHIHHNLDGRFICFSFDNDYQEDVDACSELIKLFYKKNIFASFGTIGYWAQRNIKIHRDLIENGHELFNHSFTHPDNFSINSLDRRKFDEISNHSAYMEVFNKQISHLS